jgi:hypothetical protein
MSNKPQVPTAPATPGAKPGLHVQAPRKDASGSHDAAADVVQKEIDGIEKPSKEIKEPTKNAR